VAGEITKEELFGAIRLGFLVLTAIDGVKWVINLKETKWVDLRVFDANNE
jgi:hypothetical protein